MKVLITGFNKFGGLPYNPTQLLVEELENRKSLFPAFELVTYVLPTEFQKSEIEIENLLLHQAPDIVILTGFSGAITIPTIERVALNLDDSQEPDNVGVCPKGQIIETNGREAYIAEISIEALIADLNQHGIRIGVSNHAGTFVCNHVYYIAKQFIEKHDLKAICIFLHVPFLSFESSSLSQSNSLTIINMLDVIQLLVESIIRMNDG